MNETRQTVPHTLAEDAFGLATGCLVLALGVALLHAARLTTGGVAGIALLLSYALPIAPGPLFTAINLPIFLLFWPRLGTAYTLRTIAATILLMGLIGLVEHGLVVATINRPLAAIVGGTVTGVGILAVTRHATGVGGLSAIARWLSQRTGWHFGAISMACDAAIVASAFVALGLERGFWSLVAAFTTNAMVLVWHRPDRYLAEA
ncbi:YitT family protein [Novosphingobium sp. Fuku2-ISO-50]|uniref:YitT family protein n=1 Tax=Novosphingobium sp. Fuku2-ISO-50 TaxID=1739114 RepID=UPI000ADDFC90|nr:YitT family protein [Novosphingobium sp. Fuku2-ISO-50]